MEIKYIKEILELAQGQELTIRIDDELFGFINLFYKNYKYKLLKNEIVIENNGDSLDTRKIEYKTIREIVVFADNDILKQAIEKATSMITIVSFLLSLPYGANEEIENLVNEKKEILFKNHLSRYETALKTEIQEKINCMGFLATVESVYNEMVVNILKKKKIECRADFDVFRQGVENSDNLIEKIIKGKERGVF